MISTDIFIDVLVKLFSAKEEYFTQTFLSHQANFTKIGLIRL